MTLSRRKSNPRRLQLGEVKIHGKKLKETDELEKSEEKQSSSLICKSLSEDCKFNFKADG